MGTRAPKKPRQNRDIPLQIRITPDEKEMFTEAADRQHLTVSAWIRLAALHAAKSQHALG